MYKIQSENLTFYMAERNVSWVLLGLGVVPWERTELCCCSGKKINPLNAFYNLTIVKQTVIMVEKKQTGIVNVRNQERVLNLNELNFCCKSKYFLNKSEDPVDGSGFRDLEK